MISKPILSYVVHHSRFHQNRFLVETETFLRVATHARWQNQVNGRGQVCENGALAFNLRGVYERQVRRLLNLFTIAIRCPWEMPFTQCGLLVPWWLLTLVCRLFLQRALVLGPPSCKSVPL